MAASTPITHVNVERIDDDLIVTWRLRAGVGDDVAVFVSDSPDDAGVDVRDPERPGLATLAGLDPDTRWYVHLLAGDGPFVVAAERLVTLAGAMNFRDLGGYATVDDRVVRWGRVYRSDHLGLLTDGDLSRLQRLGLRVVVDYRGPKEHQDTPSRIEPDGPIVRHDRHISDGTVGGVSLYDRITDGSLGGFDANDLATFYVATLASSAEVFGEVLTIAADADQHALAFHCTAGKDRTGLTAALLLGVLGVARGQILDDYELTNRYRSGRRMEELRPQFEEKGWDIDRFSALFTAPRAALAMALDALIAEHGSFDRYLVERAGMTPATIDAMRQHLLAS